MNYFLYRVSTLAGICATAALISLPFYGIAQTGCLPGIESISSHPTPIHTVLDHPTPAHTTPRRTIRLAMTGDKPTSTLDLSSASASLTPSVRKQLSEISSSDLIVISDNTLNNGPLMNEIKNTKTPLVFSLGDNSVASRAKAQNILSKKLEGISTVAVLPQDEASISQVWNKKFASKTAVAQMKRAQAQFDHLPHARVIGGPEAIPFKKQIANEIATGSPEELFILVGHHENGFIKGPDGTQLTFHEFSQALSQHNRQGIVLSCETISTGPVLGPTVVTTKRLLPEQVAVALKVAQNRLISFPNPTFSDFLVEYSKAAIIVGTSNTQKNIKVVARVVGGILVVTIIYIIVSDDDKKGEKVVSNY